MQVSKLILQRIMRRAGAADVARATRAGPHVARRDTRRGDHHRMPAHAEIVVGRPHQHLAAVRPAVERETLRLLAQRREAAIAALRFDRVERVTAMSVERMHPQPSLQYRAVRTLAIKDTATHAYNPLRSMKKR